MLPVAQSPPPPFNNMRRYGQEQIKVFALELLLHGGQSGTRVSITRTTQAPHQWIVGFFFTRCKGRTGITMKMPIQSGRRTDTTVLGDKKIGVVRGNGCQVGPTHSIRRQRLQCCLLGLRKSGASWAKARPTARSSKSRSSRQPGATVVMFLPPAHGQEKALYELGRDHIGEGALLLPTSHTILRTASTSTGRTARGPRCRADRAERPGGLYGASMKRVTACRAWSPSTTTQRQCTGLALAYRPASAAPAPASSPRPSKKRPRPTCSASRPSSVAARPNWSSRASTLVKAGYQPEVAYYEHARTQAHRRPAA